tara:strand:- start:5681 stop:6040 length:360 start_codon:yes stop_codon:yes gene_type:complete
MAKAKKEQKVQKTDKKKSDFLLALKNKRGNISEACHAANIGRNTYYQWIDKDEEFKQMAEDTQEGLIDLAEEKLMENIEANDNTSIIFFLKTKGKKRGYIEKQEVEVQKPFDDVELHGI